MKTAIQFKPSDATRQRLEDLSCEAVTHFLRLAHAGKRAGHKASTGEFSAYQLLQKLDHLGNQLMDIDNTARIGFNCLLSALADPDARPTALPMTESSYNPDA